MGQELKLELGKLCLGEGILYWSYGPNNRYRGTLVVELTKSGKQFGNFDFFLLIQLIFCPGADFLYLS